jgi:hypothetical protein
MNSYLDILGILAGTAGLLVGQVIEATELSGLGTLLQGGAFAVLAYAFLHTLTKTIPAKDAEHTAAMKALAERQVAADAEHTEEMKTLTDRQAAVVDKLAERQAEALNALAEAINNLRVHCAGVQRDPRDDRQNPHP